MQQQRLNSLSLTSVKTLLICTTASHTPLLVCTIKVKTTATAAFSVTCFRTSLVYKKHVTDSNHQ